jgi:rRNA maturation endonuclease Nob1
MSTAGNWLLKLRCYNCRSIFTVRGIPVAKIAAATDASACPECGAGAAKSQRAAAPAGHYVLEIQPDNDAKR